MQPLAVEQAIEVAGGAIEAVAGGRIRSCLNDGLGQADPRPCRIGGITDRQPGEAPVPVEAGDDRHHLSVKERTAPDDREAAVVLIDLDAVIDPVEEALEQCEVGLGVMAVDDAAVLVAGNGLADVVGRADQLQAG